MANEEQLAILKQGAEAWNEWLSSMSKETKDLDIDLSGADLSETRLAGAVLWRANLSGVDLHAAELSGANLAEANISGANLYGATLQGAYLRAANLSEANIRSANLWVADMRQAELSGADLSKTWLWSTDLNEANLDRAILRETSFRGTNLREANLAGCNFLNAELDGVIFGGLDLSVVESLDTAVHTGPSHISTDTFALSKGKIPEVFLRGCGLSDWEVEQVKLYNPSLSNEEISDIQYKVYNLRATQALQISRLFISYSHADSAFVDKISNRLKDKGVRYWRDTHEMRAGRIETQIDRGIRQNPTVLLVLSEHSIKSDWVEHEVRTARGLEKELGRDVLCPVALDGSWRKSRWPQRFIEQITEYYIADFSEWKDDTKFENTFLKLIEGLDLFYKKG